MSSSNSVSDKALLKNSSLLQSATTHKLTTELSKGTLKDKILLVYLVQDYKFSGMFLKMIGKALSLCDNYQSAITLGKQLGLICNDENDYFESTIEQLSKSIKVNDDVLPTVKKYLDYMLKLSKSESYSEIISSLYIMELVYLKWAEDAENHNNTLELLEYKHKEWIDLHRGKAFEIWVEFLKKEVDRHPEESDKIFESVRITLNFELEFFDETYQVGST